MKKILLGSVLSAVAVVMIGVRASALSAITVLPAANDVSLEAGTHLEYSIKVKNESPEKNDFRIYAAPYAILNDNNDIDVSNETKWSQVSKWLTFVDANGEEKPEILINLDGNSEQIIRYFVTVPEDNLPSGGQYAMIFVESDNPEALKNGINTSSRVGVTVYGETNIDAVRSGNILDMNIQNFMVGGKISGNLKVKNTGNTNLVVTQELEVESLYDKVQTIINENSAVFPERTRDLKQEWQETPGFGIFKVTYNVYILGEKTTISTTVAIVPIWMLLIIVAGILAFFGLIYLGIRKIIKKIKR